MDWQQLSQIAAFQQEQDVVAPQAETTIGDYALDVFRAPIGGISDALQGLVTLHQPQEMHDIKKPMFQFNLNYLFIADEPCLMEILPPFMHKDKFPGEVIGGSYNIHSWVRSISWGFVFNDIKKPLVVKRGDPLCYVKFTTPDLKSKVTLKECLLTDDIIRELDRKRFLTEFKKGGIINLMTRALKLRPKKLIKIKPKL